MPSDAADTGYSGNHDFKLVPRSMYCTLELAVVNAAVYVVGAIRSQHNDAMLSGD